MKNYWILLSPLLFAFLVTPYTLEGIFPNTGPTTGETRVTIYSPDFQGMNYTDHPTPKCQFPDGESLAATWIHCIGSAKNPSTQKDQTCLNCESTAHVAGTFKVKVSINGDFKDAAEIAFTYYEQPTIEYLSPPLGLKTGGTFVQVHGQGFGDFAGLSCAFGTINVDANYVSPTLITCQSPESDVADTPIPLRVTQNGQQYTATKVNYYYHSVPEISQLLPSEGPVSGGTEVILTGKHMYPFHNTTAQFENLTFAKFGDDHYVKLELINRTHCKAISPPSVSAAPVAVELTFNDQEWTKNGILFHYYTSPYVIQLKPNAGVVEGGTNVTVTGANFYNSSEIKCRFGSKTAEGHYINDNSIWCIAPSSKDLNPVDFSLSIENDHYSNNVQYQYIKKAVITGISPQCGPTTGQTQVEVTGKNFVFTDVDQVFCIFGPFDRQPATVINDTLLYCDSPSVLNKFGNNVNNTASLHFQITLNGLEIIDSKYDFNYYTMPNLFSINPKIGPIDGTTEVTVTGDNFNNSCNVRCRFSTYEVEGKLVDGDEPQIICSTPSTSCQSQSLVQVTLNGQQYTTNDHTAEETLFTHYKAPVAAYALPTSFPTSGSSAIGVYGSGFLLSKNSTSLQNGDARLGYQCRFKNKAQKVIGTTASSYFSDYYIYCKTPTLENATTNVGLEISPDGVSWVTVPNTNLTFYDSATVISVDPAFGKVKQKDAVLTVNGKNFDCQHDDCSNVKCSFSSQNLNIVTEGTRESSEVITCPIPLISRPEISKVQVSMNGVDYTTQDVYYTFYDAFVVNVDPALIPVEGNVAVKVQGLGFADTPELKVRLENPEDGEPLVCAGGKACEFEANFTSQNEVVFTAPAQEDVKTQDGLAIDYKPFNVEVSVYGDTYTNDNVQISYYEEPKLTGNLTVNPASYVIHQNAVGGIFVSINIQIPEGSRPEVFLRKARILCRFKLGEQEVMTEGKIVEYPYPVVTDFDLEKLSIECAIPPFDKEGDGTVSVALNGFNFVGDLPLKVIPQLDITNISPRCGPREGGTKVSVNVEGIQQDELTRFCFTWSTVCTPFFDQNALANPNKISTIAPPAPNQESSGGYSLLAFSANEKTLFVNTSDTQERIRNYVETSIDYLYYRRPTITKIYPHGGLNTGGTPITIEGAFFFEDTRIGCTPKCKFGDNIVDAEFISTVRLQCKSPPGALGAFVPVTVTFNGQDEATPVEKQSFAYTGRPNVESITPTTGPATGGTMLIITGKGFVDMSKYPEEFACIFKPVDGSEPPKVVPATYLNSTSLTCSTPGGWKAGSDTDVEISFNGVDYSTDQVRFKFYQVDRAYPLSGPAAGGETVTITGSGLVPSVKRGDAACKIGGNVVKAKSATATKIECVVPPASQGENYRGHADFYYTLDGEKWEQQLQGFEYYPQAEISEVIPKFVSASGGQLKVKGNNFKNDFPGAKLTCQINGSTVLGQYVNETEMTCPFRNIDFDANGDNYIQVALNGASYTPRSEDTKINVFKVVSIHPPSGVIEGGTQLLVNGVNFPEGSIPICKFGVPGRSAISFGTLVNDHQVSCAAPAAKLPPLASLPYMMPFTLAFDNDQYDTWDRTGLHYYYYYQPEIIDITPTEAPVDDSVLLTITASDAHPFNHSIIGSNLVKKNSYLDLEIICKFGDYGTTPGALLAHNQIACPTPASVKIQSDSGSESVPVEIALNGQDFAVAPKNITFGAKQISSSVRGFAWLMPIGIAGLAVIFLLYISHRKFPPYFNKETIPLVANVQRTENLNVQEVAPTRAIM